MIEDSKRWRNYLDRIVLPIAGIFFLLQFFIFIFNYNFYGVVFLIWVGWLLMIPGFLLIIVSEPISKGIEETSTLQLMKNRISDLTQHPLYDGWLLFSIALTLISQYWLTFFFMGVQIPLILFIIYNERPGFLTDSQ